MKTYKARHISFREVVEIEGWSIKVYLISQNGDFHYPEFYQHVLAKLPSWLSMQNSFDATYEKVGFLILHAAKEGILSLINWWVGENMLNTHVFLTNPEQPASFELVSGDGLGPCVWELEIMNHERLSWLEHYLKKAPNPDFEAYMGEVYNGVV